MFRHERVILHKGDAHNQANVLINDSLQACLADFGLAAVMHHTSILTTQGTQIGSVRWMAPEVLNYEGTDEAQGLHTMASDIYSLAMLWWEVCNVPF